MPVSKLTPLLDRLGPVLMQIYGLTEALHPVTCLKREEHYAGNPKLGSIGTITSSCEIVVTDSDGRGLPNGEVGEFMVRGPITFDGYWNDPEESAKTLFDGWVATGDLGYRDADGYFWIVDRKKDVIISGGFNVYTREVESAIAAHGAVAECAVLGLEHEDWGEIVHAVVQLRPGQKLSEAELITWCRSRLAGYKTPKEVTFLSDPLPRNSSGKVVKKVLVDLIRHGGHAVQ